MVKEVQMSIKLESDLRAQFMEIADKLHRPAAQIIREMMRAFIATHEQPNSETIKAIQDIEDGNINTYKTAELLYRKLGI